jgi:CelD/BcsL family acetyltransferase involved in cellulose biosynthesis
MIQSAHSIEVIHGDKIFTYPQAEWDELWRECPEATEAQTRQWQHLYRSNVARSDALLSVTARDGTGKLAALGVFSVRFDRVTLQRRLGFLGEHDVDYHGILYREGVPESIGRDMLAAALAAAGNVGAVEILNVPEESWTRRAVDHGSLGFPGFSGAPRTWLSDRYTIALPATMADYWETFSKKTRDRLKGKMRKLQREFAVEFRSTTDDTNLAAVLDEVEAVERSRWGAANKFNDDASRTFLRSMITALVHEKRCRIFTMYVNGRCMSYIVGFIQRGALRIPYLAHDISFAGNHSVGLICNIMAIEQCIQDGYREYDLTRGSEGYKSLLGGELRHNFSFRLYRSRAGERIADFNQRVISPLLRSRFTRRLRQLVRG